MAIQHTILTTIWNMAQTGALYDALGSDYYTRIQPTRTKRRAIRQLQELGYTVTLQPAAELPSGNLRVSRGGAPGEPESGWPGADSPSR